MNYYAINQKVYTEMKPYQENALDYLTVGLGYPIPSADPFAKFPPIVGYTGRDGVIPGREQVERWMEALPQSNILLRLAKDVIGIDVDNYDDKHGASTIHKAEREHGRLPQTFHSSARGGMSGIYYYRLGGLMDERELKGDLGPDSHVEVIRFSHRYAVVPPSWHQGTAARYEWFPEAPLSKDALPVLPHEWYAHMVHACDCFRQQRDEQRAAMRRFKSRPSGTAGAHHAHLDLNKATERLATTSTGSRNNVLSGIAGRFLLHDVIINGVLSVDEVWTVLLEAGLDAGLDTNEITATLHSAWSWAQTIGEQE